VAHAVVFHVRAREEVRSLPKEVRIRLGRALMAMQRGFSLGMPLSRPMPEVARGVEELRLRDQAGQYRVFIYPRAAQGILVLRAFRKKSAQTPLSELAIARRRLKELTA
jgi:phage-related protein